MALTVPSRNATYAGIGSRQSPREILALMRSAARFLADRGWTLRTGGADGADAAFAAGAGDRVELYLPWPGFNRHQGGIVRPTEGAIAMARRVHPAWGRLKRGARLLHARNCHQVLGRGLDAPAAFVLCWTPDGARSAEECSVETGGTATAIRIASEHGIPVFNLWHSGEREALLEAISRAGAPRGVRRPRVTGRACGKGVAVCASPLDSGGRGLRPERQH